VALRTDVKGREDIPRGTDKVGGLDKYVNFKAVRFRRDIEAVTTVSAVADLAGFKGLLSH
jgi:hypothetical protein